MICILICSRKSSYEGLFIVWPRHYRNSNDFQYFRERERESERDRERESERAREKFYIFRDIDNTNRDISIREKPKDGKKDRNKQWENSEKVECCKSRDHFVYRVTDCLATRSTPQKQNGSPPTANWWPHCGVGAVLLSWRGEVDAFYSPTRLGERKKFSNLRKNVFSFVLLNYSRLIKPQM